MSENHGLVEKIMSLHPCATCAIRCKGAANPHSFYARIHGWHHTWWPGWRIYQAQLRAGAAKARARA